ncbi:CD209 antigen-like protein E [Asterias rubens]|uniref:CD209 antigen-like protein E n=1 Tax=Asterias rubens TaxID=7604 RepID=UPI001455584B|nr:CD209 antigen-like protein E [Asterias rubens]
MRIVQVLSLVLGVYCGRLLAEICPPDWHRYGESCYFIIKDKMDWYQANRTCAESRANLAIPNSQSEQDYIWELFLKEPDLTTNDHLWIGCNDILEEGNWQYCPLNGDDTKAYENWADEEPNDYNGGEDCGVQDKRRGWYMER